MHYNNNYNIYIYHPSTNALATSKLEYGEKQKTNRRVNELSMTVLMEDFLISPRLPFNQFGSQNVHVTQCASDVIFAEEKNISTEPHIAS